MIQFSLIQQIKAILQDNSTIAVVGLSPKPVRPSNQVAQYMMRAGYRIIPVNPGHDEILGQPCYPDLLSVPDEIDIVNIFRRSDQVLPVVLDAIKRHVHVIWMQQGIISDDAARLGEENGVAVIMDRCIKIDHHQYFRRPDEA